MALHNQIGALGEQVAAYWLKGQHLDILELNYRKKWGEIDIVARGTEGVHFVEVKTVSYETAALLERNVSRETFRPEEKVHAQKMRRLHRAILTWISEREYTGRWQIDVLSVYLAPHEKYARVHCIQNVIFE